MVRAVQRFFFLLLVPSFAWAGPAIRWESGTTAVEVSPSTVSASQCLRSDSTGSYFYAGPGCGQPYAGAIGNTGKSSFTAAGDMLAQAVNTGGQITAGSTLTVVGNAFSIGISTFVAIYGNVGIGMAVPSSKFHLSSGTFIADGDVASIRVGISTFNITGGRVGINTAAPDRFLTVAGTSSFYSGGMEISTGAANGKPALFVRGDTGFVGIGTRTPSVPLHVTVTPVNNLSEGGVGGDVALLLERAGSLSMELRSTGDTYMQFGDASAAKSSIRQRDTDDVLCLQNGTNNSLCVGTGGNVGVGAGTLPAAKLHASSGTMLIDGYPAAISVGQSTFVVTQGNLGIGMANPASKLHLSSGTLIIDGDAATGLISSRPVVIGAFGRSVTAALMIHTTGTLTNDRALEIRNQANGQRFAIIQNGNLAFLANPGVVRMNTTDGSDDANLSLTAGGAEGDAARGAFIELYGNENVSAGDSIWSAGNVAGGNLDMRTGGVARIIVANSGNIGIPSANPATLFHISSGTLLIDGNTAGLKISTANHANTTTITNWLSATATIDYGALSASTCTFATMTLNGAADGDDIALGVPNALASIGGLSVTGFVSSNNTVTISACCVTVGACSLDAPSVTVRATIWKH